MMPSHPDHVVMPGDDPEVIQFIPVDRVLFPEAAIIPVGIGDYVSSKHIIVIEHHRHPLFSSVSTIVPGVTSGDLAGSGYAAIADSVQPPLVDSLGQIGGMGDAASRGHRRTYVEVEQKHISLC